MFPLYLYTRRYWKPMEGNFRINRMRHSMVYVSNKKLNYD